MRGAASRRESFGWPLRCPSCPAKHYYGRLKVPGDAAGNKISLHCPNCGTRLVATTSSRNEASHG